MTTKFCTACANPLVATAVICPKCGSPVNGNIPSAVGGKSKTTAVLLAVFLGTWSWLYTYKHNKAKFWITFSIIFLLAAFLIFWAAYSVRYQQGSWYASEGDRQTGVVVAQSLRALCFAFWVWAIIDNSVKPSEWYRIYASK